jgi:hypothetical protein
MIFLRVESDEALSLPTFVLSRDQAFVEPGKRTRRLTGCAGQAGQVARARGVAATDGALLEVPLQEIIAREGVAAENAHVWTVTGVATSPSTPPSQA